MDSSLQASQAQTAEGNGCTPPATSLQGLVLPNCW